MKSWQVRQQVRKLKRVKDGALRDVTGYSHLGGCGWSSTGGTDA